MIMIRSARVWDQCQSTWSVRITARANPSLVTPLLLFSILGLKLMSDCCRYVPDQHWTLIGTRLCKMPISCERFVVWRDGEVSSISSRCARLESS